LLAFYNTSYEKGVVQVTFEQSLILPVFKRGDKNTVGNYRGIACLNAMAKIFTGMLLSRVGAFVRNNHLLSEFQAGFRRNYSTIDNLFVFYNLVHLTLSNPKKKPYCFFLDLSAAFDRVDRHSLFLKLFSLGMSTKFVRVIEALYAVACAAVRVNGNCLEY